MQLKVEGSLLITLIWIGFQVKFPYFVCEITEYIVQLVAREIAWAILLQSQHPWQKLWNLHFQSLSTRGVWPKTNFGLRRREQRELENNQTFFETCVLNPFYGQKIKEKFFFREVERTTLSESGASRSSEAFQILLWDTRNLDFSIFLFCIFMNFHSHCPSFNKYYIF